MQVCIESVPSGLVGQVVIPNDACHKDLVAAVYARWGISPDSARFMFNGKVVRGTLAEYHVHAGDSIQLFRIRRNVSPALLTYMTVEPRKPEPIARNCATDSASATVERGHVRAFQWMQLPDELLLLIAQRLPLVSRRRLALTCRRWRRVVDDSCMTTSLIAPGARHLLTDAALTSMAARTYTNTRILDLGLCWRISRDALISFPRLMTQLTHVYLGFTQADDACVTQLAMSCRMLRELHLNACTGVRDESVRQLAACNKLEVLNLAQCDSLAMPRFADLANLRVLSLRSANYTLKPQGGPPPNLQRCYITDEQMKRNLALLQTFGPTLSFAARVILPEESTTHSLVPEDNLHLQLIMDTGLDKVQRVAGSLLYPRSSAQWRATTMQGEELLMEEHAVLQRRSLLACRDVYVYRGP